MIKGAIIKNKCHRLKLYSKKKKKTVFNNMKLIITHKLNRSVVIYMSFIHI